DARPNGTVDGTFRGGGGDLYPGPGASRKEAVEFRARAYGLHPVVATLAQGAIAFWLHGRPDQARAHAERGLAHPQKSGQPFDLASVLCHAAFVKLVCGNTDAAA